MVLTNIAKSGLALLFSGSVVDRPEYIGIGEGSGTASASDVFLEDEKDRNEIGISDSSVLKEVTHSTTFSSIEMSGITLSEFGVFSSGTSPSGTMWNRESFDGINFDGTNELMVQVTFRIN
jgi:hypothetical protein